MATNNVLVNNLCNWPLYFSRITGHGDVEIPANAKKSPLLSYEEVMAQIQVGNRMFIGTDGMGSHARIQIVDEKQRKELFGIEDIEMEAPIIVDVDSVKELLAIRGKQKFNERLSAMIKTEAEKKMLIDLAYKAGVENSEAWKLEAIRQVADTALI